MYILIGYERCLLRSYGEIVNEELCYSVEIDRHPKLIGHAPSDLHTDTADGVGAPPGHSAVFLGER